MEYAKVAAYLVPIGFKSFKSYVSGHSHSMLISYRIEVLELSSLKKAFFTLLTSDYSLQWYGMLSIHSMETGGGKNIWE